MQITIFGGVWFVCILISCITNSTKKIKLIAPFIISMIFQCNMFVRIQETSIGMQIVSITMLFILCIITRNTQVLNKEKFCVNNPLFVALLLYLIYFVLSSIFHNIITTKPLNLMMIIIYIGTALILLKTKLSITEEQLEKIENTIINIVIIVGVLQMLCKLGFLPIEGILKLWIYNDNNSNIIFNSKNTSAFYSTFMEPSYCGTALVGFFALVSLREVKKSNIYYLVFIVISIIMTRSTTAYIGLAIVFILIAFSRTNKRTYSLIAIPFIVIIVIIFVFNIDLLNEVIFYKSESASFRVRSNWNQYAFQNFIENPIFGLGYLRSRASSLLFTLLAEQGIIGTGLYCLIIFLFVGVYFSKKNNSTVKAHALMLMAISICQFIACPDLNNCVFWMGLYLFVLSCNVHKKREH